AVTPAGRAFDKLTERFEYFRYRLAVRHQFEHPLFSDEQILSPLPVVDIRLQEVPQDDAPFHIPHGEAARVEPAVDPIRTAEAGLTLVRTAGCDRLSPPGVDIGAVIRVNAVGGRTTLQFLERRAKIFQHVAVGLFEFTVRGHEGDDSRQAINDRTKTTLARAQVFLGLPAVIN